MKDLVPKIQKVKIIDVCEAIPDWRSRFVFGCCLYNRPTSAQMIGELTGLDRGEAVPNILSSLRSRGLVQLWKANISAEGLPHRYAANGHRFLASSWVAVKTDACPLTTEQNVFYWLYWQKVKAARSRSHLSSLIGIEDRTVRRLFGELARKGAILENAVRPPEEFAAWWTPKAIPCQFDPPINFINNFPQPAAM